MGLLTNGNSEFQRSKIQRFYLARYFESILIESEIPARANRSARFPGGRLNNWALRLPKPGWSGMT